MHGGASEEEVRQSPPPGLWDVGIRRLTLRALRAERAAIKPRWLQSLPVRQCAVPAIDLGAHMDLAYGRIVMQTADTQTHTYTHACGQVCKHSHRHVSTHRAHVIAQAHAHANNDAYAHGRAELCTQLLLLLVCSDYSYYCYYYCPWLTHEPLVATSIAKCTVWAIPIHNNDNDKNNLPLPERC